MRIELVLHTDPPNLTTEDYRAIDGLLAQLSGRQRPPSNSRDMLKVLTGGTWLYVCRDDAGAIIGMACLAIVRTPSGTKGLVEDVVVDPAHRGQGIARQLMAQLLHIARMHHVKYVDLTSSPRRVEANGLYVSLGFEVRETNVYRLTL